MKLVLTSKYSHHKGKNTYIYISFVKVKNCYFNSKSRVEYIHILYNSNHTKEVSFQETS